MFNEIIIGVVAMATSVTGTANAAGGEFIRVMNQPYEATLSEMQEGICSTADDVDKWIHSHFYLEDVDFTVTIPVMKVRGFD